MKTFRKEVTAFEERQKGKGKWLVAHVFENGEKREQSIMDKGIASQLRDGGLGLYDFDMDKPEGEKFWKILAVRKVAAQEGQDPKTSEPEAGKQEATTSAPNIYDRRDQLEVMKNRSILAQRAIESAASVVSSFAGSGQVTPDGAASMAEQLVQKFLDKADKFLGTEKEEVPF